MKVKPVVSIIMATYNREHFILESLNSIQNQTFNDWECIIIDDGGSDNTEEVLVPLLNDDSRFTYLKRTDKYLKGLPGCRNYGLDLAQGNFIIFFDDDDIVHPQNLEICVSELSNSNMAFCRYKRSVFFEEFNYDFDLSKEYETFYIKKNDVGKLITNELPFNSCAVMWRKNCFENNRFVETLMYAEEWELYSRILSQGFEGVSISKTLFYGRKHQKSNTGEFYQGNTVRVNSKIEASKLIISNLNTMLMLSPSLQKYFVWKSFSMKNRNLLNHLISQSQLKSKDKLKLSLLYNLGPFVKMYLRLKKKYSNEH
ncbi:glycosyltransferase family 2 protein [Seonamhaeicola marinus]|uniref:Glycosyltransferase family 2 protein n=1 Tax=Seonamhaeicola marinus TaxID=1912246 RepID=A0A5D0HJF9_9FLAO|nr:glycosyltransferase family 2 protein [Seonamhaeicola marinus]TYA71416.1 glycosyltransferase family 2 protein [Seonamhaeicola marinus]